MRSHFCVLLLFILLGISRGHAQNRTADSLKQLLPTATKEKQVEILQNIITALWLNHPDTAMIYARQAMVLAKDLDVRHKAIATRMMGGVYYYKGFYDSTIEYSHKAFRLSEAAGDSSLMNNAMNNIGLAYYSVGSYPEALEYLLKALNIKRKLKQTYGMAQTLNNVGLVYNELKEYDKARQYFNESETVARSSDDKNLILYSLNNIGLTYLKQDQLEKAEGYFQQSLEAAKQVDNVIWHSATYSYLGQVYLKRKLTDKAQEAFSKSMSLRKKIDDLAGISETYALLSNVSTERGKFDSAIYFLNQSQKIAKEIGARDQELLNYDAYKEVYAKRKKFDSAFFYQTKFIALRDSLFDKNLVRNISNIQLQIQEDEARQQLEVKDTLLQNRTLQAYILSGLVVLTFIFAYMFFRYYRKQKKLSYALARKNQEIIGQKEEIESQKEALLLSNAELENAHDVIIEQNRELAELNQKLQSTVDIRTEELKKLNKELNLVNLELDNFIYKSSHDIKGPLVRLLGVCHVALIDVEDNKAREYLLKLNDTARHLNELFDRLKMVSDINSLEVHHEKIDFKSLLTKIKSMFTSRDGFEKIRFEEDINHACDFYSDPFLMETIFSNMLENSIKFQKKSAQENKFIRVAIRKVDDQLIIDFIDNGIGIKEPDIEHLFQMFSKAALEHQTVGLGLYTVKQCLSKLRGNIRLVRNPEGNTQFEVKLPL